MLQFNKRKQCCHRHTVQQRYFLFHFLSRHYKLHFCSCICVCEENEEFQRERPFDAGFSIGARAPLLAHDFP